MKTSLSARQLAAVRGPLKRANTRFARAFPGEPTGRQPVHTFYEGAHLFRADAVRRHAEAALRALETDAPDGATLARALGLSPEVGLAETVYQRVRAKLAHEAIEDLRLDFEDGYGMRPDAEEDGHAVSAASEVALGLTQGSLPPFIGIRIKCFSEELFARSARTLDLFVTTLLARTRGRLPPGFVVTLPKVTVPEQVTVLVQLLALLEKRHRLRAGSLQCELMVETPQSVIGPDGRVALPALVRAARGRCRGAHFGTYDYTTSCGITAAYQSMGHLACDFARHAMQVSLAGTGVALSDGSTNQLPVGPHGEGELTGRQREENRAAVHAAWQRSYRHVRHSLENAFYQGWDLHPAQLPARYAAVYSFYLESLAASAQRLRSFIARASEATLQGEVFDDAATGQALLNFFLRGLACGALTEDEALSTGLTLEELRGRSFLRILEGRRVQGLAA